MNRTRAWALLAAAVVGALVVVSIPVEIVRPFAAQTSGGLALAFRLRRWSPLITAVAALAALVAGWHLWRGGRWASRTGVAAAGLLALGTAWFARQQYFEWKFAPLPDVRFVRAGLATFVAPGQMVLAVSREGEAAAYPVQQLAYHHLVQDAVGGVPIVATY